MAQAIEQQIRVIEAAEVELLTTMESVRELSEKAVDREALVPVGSGVMVASRLGSIDKLLVLLGQNIYAKMSPTGVTEYLNKRLGLVRSQTEELAKQYSSVLQRLQLLQPKITRLAEELQQAG
ncbi:MAG: hypothetical protein M1357_00485 [Candidatus Marsarchaeota archaeon]|nr:hypothetical protein [Candidatus Marsarchaeota archaeon]